MARQKEIREGLYDLLGSWFLTDDILDYLHSKRCRIEIDGELPEPPEEVNDIIESWRPVRLEEIAMFKGSQKWMLKAGYVAVEPLIEETKRSLTIKMNG